MVVWLIVGATGSFAQSSSFTYQGRLTDGGTAANGNYDLQFALFDSLSGGTQVGSTQTLNTVAVSNGVFTVSLDFGPNAFSGANRFLEISARPSGSGSFTTLSPRQQITSTPYAVRSLNAASADSIPASGVPAGSGNYIQNSASAQPSSNFNINGNGTAGGTLSGNLVNATTQYNLNGSRILSNPGSDNLFAGVGAGAASTTGAHNTFFGNGAGTAQTIALDNTFVGFQAGKANTSVRNTFVGSSAGTSNTIGQNNAFFGVVAGSANETGNRNAFFGLAAGTGNVSGSDNAFFGTNAGQNNVIGEFNSYFGEQAGLRATGSSNTFVGALADFTNESPSGNRNTLVGANTTLGSGGTFSPDNATAIGANARVDQANSLVLGSINGINGATADTKVGIGTTAPKQRLHVKGQGVFTADPATFDPGDGVGPAIRIGFDSNGGYGYINANNTGVAQKNLILQGNLSQGSVGIGTVSPDQKLTVNGGASKPGGGSWVTFSDERLKNIKGRFTPGLKAVLQLQPLRYEYKRDNALNLKSEGEHVGFSAQAVQKIIPEAVTKNDKGYLLVNNDPILWTMLNAIKEQQAQIEQQQMSNEEQRRQISQEQSEMARLNARLQTIERALRKKSSAPRRR